MPASIRSTLRYPPAGPVQGSVLTDESRDDLQKGYQVVLESVVAHTTYSWDLVFTPESPDGTDSTATLTSTTASTTSFVVDNEGAYLVRLTVDASLSTEDTAYYRFRAMTRYGDLKLVAAGERRDGTGVIPTDATSEGWTNDQNRNMQLLLAQVRRVSTTGRSLFVDANRGRDDTNTPDDPTVTYELPGSDVVSTVDDVEFTARSHGDFATVGEAITYALAAVGRGEAALSATTPFWIFVKPGLYVEDLELQPWIYIVGGTGGAKYTSGLASDVVIRTANSGGGTHTYTSATAPTDICALFNVTLDNTDASTVEGVLSHTAGYLALHNCKVWQRGNGSSQGPAYEGDGAGAAFTLYAEGTEFRSDATTDNNRVALTLTGVSAAFSLVHCDVVGRSALFVNSGQSAGVVGSLESCKVRAGDGYGIRAHAGSLSLAYTEVSSTNDALNFVVDDFGLSASTLDLSVEVNHGTLQQINYDSAATTGSTELILSSVRVSDTGAPLVLTTGALTSYSATVTGRSIVYVPDWEDPSNVGVDVVPVRAQLSGKHTTQDAIDLLANLANPLASADGFGLQAAYDGIYTYDPFVAGSGLGNEITVFSGRAIGISGPTTEPLLEVRGPLRSSGFVGGYTKIDSTDNTYDVLTTDEIIGVDTSTGSLAILVRVNPSMLAGTRIVVKDEGGNAAVNNIVISTMAGTIDGNSSITLATNYASVTLYANGVNWFIY